MTPTQIFVSKILNEIGCSVVIGCITVTTVILAIFRCIKIAVIIYANEKQFNLHRSKSFERMLHLGQEITLLIAHVCIITLFPRTGIEVTKTFKQIIDFLKSMFRFIANLRQLSFS